MTNSLKSWEISDPLKRMVLVHRLNSDDHSILILQETSCNFQYGPNLNIPSYPTFGSDEFSSLGKGYSRQTTESLNCENYPVSFVMKYCPTSTRQVTMKFFNFVPPCVPWSEECCVCLFHDLPGVPAPTPAPNIDFRLNEHLSVEYKLIPVNCYREHDPTCQIQSFLLLGDLEWFGKKMVARILTILTSGFVASFPHVN